MMGARLGACLVALCALIPLAHAQTEASLQASNEGSYAMSVRGLTLMLEMSPEVDGVRTATYQLITNGAPVFEGVKSDLFSLFYGPHFRFVEMDQSNDTPELFVSTYSGGAHCCNEVEIVTKGKGGWTVVDAGAFDGDAAGLYPRDVDGDGDAEMVTYDNRFLYQFASYAGSFAPRQILALQGGTLVDVSRQEAYQWEIRSGLDRMGKAPPAGEGRNSWLAAYAATLLQLGQDDPLDYALGSYDESVDWGMIRCSVATQNGSCPDGKQVNVGFEAALTEFLTETGYLKAE